MDLAGFAAAVYLRGVPLVQVPTHATRANAIHQSGGKPESIGIGKNLDGGVPSTGNGLIDTETLARCRNAS